MNYQEELEIVKRDYLAFRVWKSEFRPEITLSMALEATDVRKQEKKLEAEKEVRELYYAQKKQRLLDPGMHVISKMVIIQKDLMIDDYKACLELAINLSKQLETAKEGFFTRLFGRGISDQLKKLDREMEKLRIEAQKLIDMNLMY